MADRTLPDLVGSKAWRKGGAWKWSTRAVAGLTAFTFTFLQFTTPFASAEQPTLPDWLKEENGGWVSQEQAARMQKADQDLLTHLSALEQAQQRFVTTHPSGLEVQYADQEAVVARDSAGNLLWAPTLDDYRKVQNGTLLLVDGTLQVVKEGQLARQVDAMGNEAVFRADGRVDHEVAADGTQTDYTYSETGFTRTTYNPGGDLVQEYNAQGRLIKETTYRVVMEGGGGNVALGRTVATSTAFSGSGGSRAVDGMSGDKASGWVATNVNGGGDWLKLDMGSVKEINRIVYDTRYAPAYLTAASRIWQEKFTIEGSVDGVNWFPLLQKSGLTTFQLFDVAIAAVKMRYVKVSGILSRYAASATWHYAYVNELGLYETASHAVGMTVDQESVYTYDAQGRLAKVTESHPVTEGGGGNVALGRTVATSSALSGAAGTRAADGLFGTESGGWVGGNINGGTDWLKLDMGSVKEINRIVYDTRYAPAYLTAASRIWQEKFTIEGSVDGVNWFPLLQKSGLTTFQLFDVAIAATKLRYVKVSGILSRYAASATWHYAYVNELEVFETPAHVIGTAVDREYAYEYDAQGRLSKVTESHPVTETSGGGNVALKAASSASSTYAAYTPSLAVDGQTGDKAFGWMGATVNGSADSLQVDLGSIKQIDRILYDTRFGPGYLSGAAMIWQTDFKIWGSEDGITWTSLLEKSGLTTPQLFNVQINPANVRYVKVFGILSRYAASSTWHRAYTGELSLFEKTVTQTRQVVDRTYQYEYDAQGQLSKVTESHPVTETSGGGNVALKAATKTSSAYSTYTGSLAVDGQTGDKALGWMGATINGSGDWLQVDMGAVKEVDRLLYDTRFGPGYLSGAAMIWQTAFKIWGSEDGITWTSLLEKSGLTTPQLFNVQINPTKVRYVKVFGILSRYAASSTWHRAYAAELSLFEKTVTQTRQVIDHVYPYDPLPSATRNSNRPNGVWNQAGWPVTPDRIAPTGSIQGPAVTEQKEITLTLTASDPAAADGTTGSGVAFVRFSLNGGQSWSSPQPIAPTLAVTLPEQYGDYSISVEFQDKAGNRSGTVVHSVTLGTTPPPVLKLASASSTTSELYDLIVQVDGLNRPAQRWRLGRGQSGLIASAAKPSSKEVWARFTVTRSGELPAVVNPPSIPEGERLTQTLTDGSVALYVGGKLVQVTLPDGTRLIAPTQDATGRITGGWLTTPDGTTTFLQGGAAVWSKDSLGTVTWYFPDGAAEAAKTADGTVSTYAYQLDSAGKVTSILVTAGEVSALYDPDGRLIQQLRADGRRLTYTQGRLSAIEFPNQPAIRYTETVQTDGSILSERPAAAQTDLPRRFLYAADGSLREVTQADGTILRFSGGIPTEAVAPNGSVTRLSAEQSGQTLQTLSINRNGIIRTYDASGKLTRLTLADKTGLDLAGETAQAVLLADGTRITDGVYGADSKLISGTVTLQDGRIVRYAGGQPVEATLPDGSRVTYSGGQPSQLNLAGGLAYSLAHGNSWIATLTTAAPASDSITQMVYSEGWVLLKAARADGAQLAYANGRLNTLTQANGTVISYAYDNAGRLTSTVAASPDPAEPVIRSEYAYDRIRKVFKGSQLLYEYSYEFDESGDEISVLHELVTGLTKRYRGGLLISQMDADGAMTAYSYTDNAGGWLDALSGSTEAVQTLPDGTAAYYQRQSPAPDSSWQLVRLVLSDGREITDLTNPAVAGQVAQAALPKDSASLFRIQRLGILKPIHNTVPEMLLSDAQKSALSFLAGGQIAAGEYAGLVPSYAQVPANDPLAAAIKDRAYSYDQAATAIALTTAGKFTEAGKILEALAQRENGSGRLGFAYRLVPSAQDDPAIYAGTLAWVGMAALFYQQQTGDGRFLPMAERLAKTLLGFQDAGTGLIQGGLSTQGTPLGWISTEHNVETYFFLRDLTTLTRKETYAAAAARVKEGILKELWKIDHFKRGRGDDALMLDPQALGALFLLAVNKREEAFAVRAFIEKNFLRAVEVDGRVIIGYAPHSADSFIWTEGSLMVGLLDRRMGNWTSTEQIARQMESLRELSGGGLRYASGRAITQAPNDGTTYTNFPSASATAWYLLANLNPSALLDASPPAAAGTPRIESAGLSQSGKVKERFTYRYEGGLTHITDDSGTTRVYDAFNQMVAIEQIEGPSYLVSSAKDLSIGQMALLAELDPSSTEALAILANPAGEEISVHRLTHLTLADGTVVTENFAPDTIVAQEFDSQGRLLTRSQANGQITLYENGRPTQTLDTEGNVTTRFTYNEAGQLVKLTLYGARRELTEGTASARAEVIRKRADALEELAIRKQLAIGQLADQTAQARTQLQNQLTDLGQKLSDLENTDVHGREAKKQKGRALDQIRAGMNQVRSALSSLDQQYSQALGGMESQVESVRNQLESQSASAFTSITTKEEEFARQIIFQEVTVILTRVYRNVIGRDPDEKETSQAVDQLYAQFGANPEAALDLTALEQKIRALPDYPVRVQQVAQIRQAVSAKLDSWAAASDEQKTSQMAPYGVSLGQIVPLNSAAIAEIRTWLNTNSLHFGHSAFLALQGLLAQAEGIQVDTVTLAVEAIWLDILTGVISPRTTGDLELSLFSMEHVSEKYGLDVTPARVSLDDLKAMLPKEITFFQTVSPDGRTSYELKEDGTLEIVDLSSDQVKQTVSLFAGLTATEPSITFTQQTDGSLLLQTQGLPVGGIVSFWTENDQAGEAGVYYIKPLDADKSYFTLPAEGVARIPPLSYRPGHARVLVFKDAQAIATFQQRQREMHPWSPLYATNFFKDILVTRPGVSYKISDLDQMKVDSSFMSSTGLMVFDLSSGGNLTEMGGFWNPPPDPAFTPQQMLLTPDGNTLWVRASGKTRTGAAFLSLDLRTGVVSQLDTGLITPAQMALSLDGTILYVQDAASPEGGLSSLVAMDAATGQVLKRAPLPVGALAGMAVTAGNQIILAGKKGTQLFFLNAATLQTVRVTSGYGSIENLALRPDGQVAYLLDSSRKKLIVVSTSTGQTLSEVQTDGASGEVAFSPDGTVVYFTRHDTGTVLRLDAASHQPIQDVREGEGGTDQAFRRRTAPILAHVNGNHYLHVLAVTADGKILVREPNKGPNGSIVALSAEEFSRIWQGVILSPRAPPHAYQRLTDSEALSITGSFFPVLFAIFAAVASAIGTAVTAIIGAVAALLATLGSVLASVFSALGTAFSSIGSFFGGFGSLFSGTGLIGQGVSALFAGKLLTGLALIGKGILGAVGLSSFSWASLGQFALTTAVNVGVSRGLEALGVSPTIASLAGAFTSGGISGALNPVSTTSSFLTKFVAGALTSTAIAGTQIGLVKAGLDPALANIAGIGVGTITNSLALNGLNGLGQTLSTQLAPTLAGELGFYGIQKLGESIGLDPRISQLAGMPIKAGIGNIANPATRGQGIVNSMWEGLKQGAVSVGLSFATQDFDPLLGNLASSVITGAIDGLLSPKDPNQPLGQRKGVFAGIGETITRAFSGFTEIGVIKPGDPLATAQSLAKLNDFTTITREQGLGAAVETYATSLLHRSSIESLLTAGQSLNRDRAIQAAIQAQIADPNTPRVDLEGVEALQINLGGGNFLWYNPNNHALLATLQGQEYIRHFAPPKVHEETGILSPTDALIERKTVDPLTGAEILTRIKLEAAGADWIEIEGPDQRVYRIEPDNLNRLRLNNDGTVKDGILTDIASGSKYTFQSGQQVGMELDLSRASSLAKPSITNEIASRIDESFVTQRVSSSYFDSVEPSKVFTVQDTNGQSHRLSLVFKPEQNDYDVVADQSLDINMLSAEGRLEMFLRSYSEMTGYDYDLLSKTLATYEAADFSKPEDLADKVGSAFGGITDGVTKESFIEAAMQATQLQLTKITTFVTKTTTIEQILSFQAIGANTVVGTVQTETTHAVEVTQTVSKFKPLEKLKGPLWILAGALNYMDTENKIKENPQLTDEQKGFVRGVEWANFGVGTAIVGGGTYALLGAQPPILAAIAIGAGVAALYQIGSNWVKKNLIYNPREIDLER